MVAVAAAPLLVGSQVPRIRVVPDGDEHPQWDEVVGFVRELGVVLDPWQEDVLWASLLRRGGMWAAFAVAVCCSRQNGKNLILEMRELAGAYFGFDVGTNRTAIHSAHLADTSMESFMHLDDLIEANGWLSKDVMHVRRQNGHEQIKFANGSRIRFRTRTRGGGRGFSAPFVIFDEPMFLSEVSMGSILPVVSAQPDPQVWYTGSAVDQLIHEDGVVFARVREDGLAGTNDRLAYFEWSLDYDDPAAVPDDVLRDPEALAATNPAYGIRIMPDYLYQEHRELSARTLAVERFGVGDWPRTDGVEETPLSYQEWAALKDAGSSMVDPVCLAFDVSPDREATIAAAGRRVDGKLHVEVLDQHAGTRWLPGRLAELCEQHPVESVVCDPFGPAGSVVALVEEAGTLVSKLTTRDVTEACGLLVDSVREKHLHHLGSIEIANAVRAARTRPLGDAWCWSRKASSVDISPLVAATLAVAQAALLPDDATPITIY